MILHIVSFSTESFNSYLGLYPKSWILIRLQLPTWYRETWAPQSHSRVTRCSKPGLRWKPSNFCSNLWLYKCKKTDFVYAAGWSGSWSFADSLLHTRCETLSNCIEWHLLLWTNHPCSQIHCSSPLELSSQYSCAFFKISDTAKALEKKIHTALQQV